MEQRESTLRALVRDTRGATAIEYIVLVALVAVGSLAAHRTFGSSVAQKAEREGECNNSDGCLGGGSGGDDRSFFAAAASELLNGGAAAPPSSRSLPVPEGSLKDGLTQGALGD